MNAYHLGERLLSFTSLPCAQDTGGENPYIDTQDVLKLLIVGDSAVGLLVTLGARSANARRTAAVSLVCLRHRRLFARMAIALNR